MKGNDYQFSVVNSLFNKVLRGRENPILRLALPSVVTNITVPLLGLVDTAVVGHMGRPEYIGAIAIGTTIFSMIYWIFAFLRMGTTGIVSQAYGAHDEAAEALGLVRSVKWALGISAALLLLQSPLLSAALWLMEPEAEIAVWAAEYFRVCIWGAPAALLNYSLTGWYIGMQNTRVPMWTAILQNLLNIAATLVFVFVLDWGVAGVAAGTILGLYGGVAFAISRLPRSILLNGNDTTYDGRLPSMGVVGGTLFLRTLCLVAVTVYFTTAGSRMGGLYLDANALLMQFFIIFSYFTDGLANAAEALSGKFAGARDGQGLRSTVRQLFGMGFVLALAFTLLYVFAGSWFLSLLTNQAAVVAVARDYLPWVCAIPFVSLAAFIWDGVFIGMTATREMFLSMLAAAITFFAIWFLLGPGNHILWLSFLSYLCARSVVQGILWVRLRSPLRVWDSSGTSLS